jgi:hypothetical protein
MDNGYDYRRDPRQYAPRSPGTFSDMCRMQPPRFDRVEQRAREAVAAVLNLVTPATWAFEAPPAAHIAAARARDRG